MENAEARLADYNVRQGSPLSDASVSAAAAAGLKMGGAIGNLDAALKYQFEQFVMQQNAMADRINGVASGIGHRNNKLGMGSDQSGRFSHTAPMW